MVNVTKGVLIECDPAIKQFLLNLDETCALGRKFVLHDVDEHHLFVEAEILKTIQDKIDELLDKMSIPYFPIMSARAREAGKVLDQVARSRRQKKALESLEQDNFQDEPHADLVMSKRAPKFQESLDTNKSTTKKRKFRPTEFYKKYRKTIPQMIEEDIQKRDDGNCLYVAAQVPPSKLPLRHFCNVCGFAADYTCVQCGVRYCSVKCYSTHQDTRCLKWTA